MIYLKYLIKAEVICSLVERRNNKLTLITPSKFRIKYK